MIANADQADADGDGRGDVCDSDRDGDDVENDVDNCPSAANPPQTDLDFDGLGDVCDADLDGDAVENSIDNCVQLYNPDQADVEADGLGDICDPDDDGDAVSDDVDNCPLLMNAAQLDFDGDGAGDVCDADDRRRRRAERGRRVPVDRALDEIVTANGCSLSASCPCAGPVGQDRAWRNHNQYVWCVVKSASEHHRLGLLTNREWSRAITDAARSTCGQRHDRHHRWCHHNHHR